MRQTPVSVGILGWSNVTRTPHAPCLAEMDEFELAAACDPDLAQRATAQERYARQAYRDLQAFLQHPGLELAVIVTPNHLNGPLAIAALEAGKHTIVKKPTCISIMQADTMLARAREHGRALTVH